MFGFRNKLAVKFATIKPEQVESMISRLKRRCGYKAPVNKMAKTVFDFSPNSQNVITNMVAKNIHNPDFQQKAKANDGKE